MKTIEFRLETGDRNCGVALLPKGHEGRLPVIVHCHGSGGDRTLPVVIERIRSAAGYRPVAVVSFDFYGCGGTGGDANEISYGRWRNNIADVFNWIHARPWADPARCGCLAMSAGTTAALRYAATSPLPRFIISVATCIGSFIQAPGEDGEVRPADLEDLVAGKREELFGTRFGLEFFRDFTCAAPVRELRTIGCPVLFLQGGADNPWRRADAWLGYQILKGRGARHVEIEGGDHTLEAVAPEAAEHARAWLDEIDFGASR